MPGTAASRRTAMTMATLRKLQALAIRIVPGFIALPSPATGANDNSDPRPWIES